MPESDYDAMCKAVIEGDRERARNLAAAAVAAEDDLLAVVERGFAAGIRAVGRLWEEGEYFLPELVQGAEAMKAAMAEITPALGKGDELPSAHGRVVIGTVQGDMHDIGKTLVAALLEAHGFVVHDLGADVPAEAFVSKAREVNAQVIAASALLTTTMPMQRKLVEAVAAAGLSATVRVLVGGAPASAQWADEIGAAFAENAQQAVAAVRGLLP